MEFKVRPGSNEVVFPVQKKLYPLEVVQGAAYLLTDRAVAYVEDKRGAWELTLRAKAKASAAELEALAGDFLNELLNQVLRQRLLAANRSVMEHVIARAVVSARRDPADPAQPPAAAEDQLSAEQRSEIDRLIAEAEAEIAARAKNRAAADPLGISKTWEERHGKERVG